MAQRWASWFNCPLETDVQPRPPGWGTECWSLGEPGSPPLIRPQRATLFGAAGASISTHGRIYEARPVPFCVPEQEEES